MSQITPMRTRTVYPLPDEVYEQLTPTERYNLLAVTSETKAQLHTNRVTAEKDEALRKKVQQYLTNYQKTYTKLRNKKTL